MLKRLIKILIFSIITISILWLGINHIYRFKEPDPMNELVSSIIKVEDQFSTEKIQDEEDLFQTIEKGLLEGKDSIIIDNKLINDDGSFLFDTIEQVLMSNPEIMYYKGGRYSKGLLSFEYSKPIEDIKLHQEAIRKKRDEIILHNIRSDMSDYEKVKTIHDYIIDITKYDRRYLNDEEVPDESHSVYGVLNEGVALCGGYAKTMKYLLDAVDIECIVVIGKTKYDNHAWNIIKIDGYYYHIDATWDDPVTADGSDVLSYDYFNLKDEDIEKTHSWNRADYPQCNSDKHNYYYYNGLVVNSYNDFYNRIEKSLLNKNKVFQIKVLGFDEEIYNIPNTINVIVNDKIQLIDIKDYRYRINDEQGIVTIEFNYNR